MREDIDFLVHAKIFITGCDIIYGFMVALVVVIFDQLEMSLPNQWEKYLIFTF